MVKRSTGDGAASGRDRIHLRVARDVKDMLEQAAALSTGGDVTAFVVGAAADRARLVLSDLEVTRVDDSSRRRFYDLVMNPPEPSDRLKKLLASDAFRVVS
ncbi:MAG TPA: DUF1778 domain-containing protein [Candidatus Elarobacter sp.]|nr:DUF1778 domain-containing protein [Candidatus Elarobacter sp.]HEV2739092.1 DUF1778 domain-containing protein [Candidatus Elarobacter sp.]